jgi:hypothetical protein
LERRALELAGRAPLFAFLSVRCGFAMIPSTVKRSNFLGARHFTPRPLEKEARPHHPRRIAAVRLQQSR